MNSETSKFIRKILLFSLELKKGDKIYIDINGDASEQLQEYLFRQIINLGCLPKINVTTTHNYIQLVNKGDKEYFEYLYLTEKTNLELMDAYLNIKIDTNKFNYKELNKKNLELYYELYHLPKLIEASKKKWLVTELPTDSMAQFSELSTNQLRKIFFNASNIDFTKYDSELSYLKRLLDNTENIRVTGTNTNLSFSKKNIKSFICDGKSNLPDGEIFTAPIKESLEGYISFNLPTSFMGIRYNNIYLEFNKGRVVNYKSDNNEALGSLLNKDEGSCYIGEFGIGFNPYIYKPMQNTLFDEKMAGSLHLAIGQSYEMANNENSSSIHVDFILCQLKEFGGGEIYFDNNLIRKDGYFTPIELNRLNRIENDFLK